MENRCGAPSKAKGAVIKDVMAVNGMMNGNCNGDSKLSAEDLLAMEADGNIR